MTTLRFSVAEELSHWATRGARQFLRWNWRHYSFYFGVPIILALYSTVNNWELLRGVGFAGTAMFYLAHALVPFWFTCLATRLTMELLRSVRPRQIILLTLGSVASSVVMLPYAEWLTQVFITNWGMAGHDPAYFSLEPDDLISGTLPYMGRALVIWIGVNLIFDRMLGLPRYRYAAEAATQAMKTPADSVEPPGQRETGSAPRDTSPGYRFLERLSVPVAPSEVLSLRAEQHYIRIHTPAKDHVVLYRFSDAIAELGDDCGMQVHRSHWVRTDAIAALRSNSKKMLVILNDGQKVPVSGPYQQLVRQLANRRGIPVRPLTRG